MDPKQNPTAPSLAFEGTLTSSVQLDGGAPAVASTGAAAPAAAEASDSFPLSDSDQSRKKPKISHITSDQNLDSFTNIDSFTMDPKEASNLTDVALKITSHLLMTEGKEKNIVYSPLSIQVVLWLLTAGSKGPTQDQLLSFLKSDSTEQLHSLASHLVPLIFADGSNRGGPRLCFANSLWVKDYLPIKPSFKEVVDTVYKAAIRHVSFENPEEVRHEVNLWAEKETKGHITEALPPKSVDKYTMLIFSNALYFKGLWSDKFNARETKEDDFHLLNGTSVKAPFMTSSKKQFVEEFDGFKVLKLFYEQGKDMKRQFSMYLLLPDSRDGLPALVKRVCSEPGFLDSHRPQTPVRVGEFKIPMFKFTSTFEASKILKDLGLLLPFNGGDLTEMVEASPDECKIYHKSFIEVNEKGTEAAAVSTAVVKGFGCKSRRPPRPQNIDFVADHPFMLFIREEMTETIFVEFLMYLSYLKQLQDATYIGEEKREEERKTMAAKPT